MKKSWICTAAFFLLVIFTGGCGRLADRVDRQIELVGSELTGVSVTVRDVRIRLGRGLGEIGTLTIANPEGYVATNAFEMDQLRMNLGIFSTLAGDPLVLDELVISSPVVNLQKTSRESSNLREISENAEENMAEADRKLAAEEPASKDKPGEPFRIVVRRLVIEGVTLNVRLADGTTRSGTLPSIELTDVGGDEGVTPGGLGLTVIGAMAGEMLKQAVARELVERSGDIREALSARNIMEVFVDRMNLTPGQVEKVRPAVERFSEGLAATVDAWVEQRYIDRDRLSENLEPLLEKIGEQLEAVLDGEQVQELQRLLRGIKEDAFEVVRFAVIEIMSERLGVTPEQAAQLRPILRENMVALSARLRELTTRADRSFEDFKAAYDTLGKELRHRLGQVLDADQMRSLDAMQDELLRRIRNRSFGIAEKEDL